MNIPFFTDYLMLSNSLSIGIIAVFVLALIGIYVLQRKGTSFGGYRTKSVAILVPKIGK